MTAVEIQEAVRKLRREFCGEHDRLVWSLHVVESRHGSAITFRVYDPQTVRSYESTSPALALDDLLRGLMDTESHADGHIKNLGEIPSEIPVTAGKE